MYYHLQYYIIFYTELNMHHEGWYKEMRYILYMLWMCSKYDLMIYVFKYLSSIFLCYTDCIYGAWCLYVSLHKQIQSVLGSYLRVILLLCILDEQGDDWVWRFPACWETNRHCHPQAWTRPRTLHERFHATVWCFSVANLLVKMAQWVTELSKKLLRFECLGHAVLWDFFTQRFYWSMKDVKLF